MNQKHQCQIIFFMSACLSLPRKDTKPPLMNDKSDSSSGWHTVGCNSPPHISICSNTATAHVGPAGAPGCFSMALKAWQPLLECPPSPQLFHISCVCSEEQARVSSEPQRWHIIHSCNRGKGERKLLTPNPKQQQAPEGGELQQETHGSALLMASQGTGGKGIPAMTSQSHPSLSSPLKNKMELHLLPYEGFTQHESEIHILEKQKKSVSVKVFTHTLILECLVTGLLIKKKSSCFLLNPPRQKINAPDSQAATKEGGVLRRMEINKNKSPSSGSGKAQNVLVKTINYWSLTSYLSCAAAEQSFPRVWAPRWSHFHVLQNRVWAILTFQTRVRPFF